MSERLSTKQALRVLGWTHRNTLGQRVKAGEITPIRDKGRNYYSMAELERYMKREVPITVEEAHRRAQEAADYADRGLDWPPRQ